FQDHRRLPGQRRKLSAPRLGDGARRSRPRTRYGDREMSGEPIFVVGAPRSGTTLLAAQLAAHSKLSCGPETHFFRWFAQADAAALLQPTTWPAPALDFIGAIRYRQFDDQSTAPLIKKYGVTAAQIESALRQMPPSAA